MAGVAKNVSVCLFLLSLASGALCGENEGGNNNCPQKNLIEISGKVNIKNTLVWREVTIPDQFIVNFESLGKADVKNISDFTSKFEFTEKLPIEKITNDDDYRVGVIYKGNLGDFYYQKMFFRKKGFHSCMPSSSINIKIGDLPGALVYARAQESKSKCMWNLTVLGINDDVRHVFYMPVACEKKFNNAEVVNIISMFKEVIPSSAYKER